MQLKNIIIADCTTRNYFFCTFYIASCTNWKYNFSKCIIVCKTCNVFFKFFFCIAGCTTV